MSIKWRMLPVLLAAILLTGCGLQEAPETTSASGLWQTHYEAGLSHMEQKLYGQAIDAFTQAIQADPMEASAYVQRGSAYYLARISGEYTAAALADFNQALTLDPGCVDAWLGLADVALRESRFEDAAATLETALEYTGQDSRIQARLDAFSQGDYRDSYKNYHKVCLYAPDGSLRWYAVFRYVSSDSSGWKRQVTSFDAQDRQLSQVTETYDQLGRPLVQVYEQDLDGSFGRSELSYDDQGQVQREALFSSTGEPISKEIYWYNEAGQMTRLVYENYEKGTSGYDVLAYNDQGLMATRHRYTTDSVLSRIEVYTYDEEGRTTGVTTYSAPEVLQSYFTVEYGENSVTTRCYDGGGRLERYRVADEDGITWYDPQDAPMDSMTFR